MLPIPVFPHYSKPFQLSDNYTFFCPVKLKIVKEFNNKSDKQKRSYMRIRSGVDSAFNRDMWLRFLTLTTATNIYRIDTMLEYPKNQRRYDKGKLLLRSLTQSFNLFKLRIERATPEKDGFKGFKFNKYFKIETYEGNGVLHIVFWGTKKHFIPKEWITNTWAEIHGSPVTDIRLVKEKNKLVNYLISSYLYKNPIKRMSCGWRWLWRGFYKTWKIIKEVYFYSPLRATIGNYKNALKVLFWRCQRLKPNTTQKTLKDYGFKVIDNAKLTKWCFKC